MACPLAGIEVIQAMDRAIGQIDRFGQQHVEFTQVEAEIARRQLVKFLDAAVAINRMLNPIHPA